MIDHRSHLQFISQKALKCSLVSPKVAVSDPFRPHIIVYTVYVVLRLTCDFLHSSFMDPSRGFVLRSVANMLSGDGRCKTFDATADGYIRGRAPVPCC